MKFARSTRWIPCLLGALAVHLLVLALWQGAAPRVRGSSTEPVDVGPWVRSHIEPVDSNSVASGLESIVSEIAQSGTPQPWAGTYSWGAQHHGPFFRIHLGQSSYVIDDGDRVRERGTFAVGADDLVQLRPNGSDVSLDLPHQLAWIAGDDGPWLAPIEMVPSLFYIQAGSQFSAGRPSVGCFQRRDAARARSGGPMSLPSCYTTARDALPHLSLLSLATVSNPNGSSIGQLARGPGDAVEPGEVLTWDAEPLSQVQAVVRDVRGSEVEVLIRTPDCMSPEAITPGTTFSRLPRLE